MMVEKSHHGCSVFLGGLRSREWICRESEDGKGRKVIERVIGIERK